MTKLYRACMNFRHKLQWISVIIVFVLSSFASLSLARTIKIMGGRVEIGHENNYFVALTKMVLSKTSHLYPEDSIEIIKSHEVTQWRLFRFLDYKELDIIWSATSSMRELKYLPIRIPLTKGMLGYRVLLTHKDNQEHFKNILNENELKRMIACQGAHWPDSDILEDNDYKVARVVHYEAMFKMISKKRCDYFPRAIYEGKVELAKRNNQYPNLILVEKLLLKYHLPTYFFVSKTDTVLAKRLYEGLVEALKDGSLIHLMKSQKSISHIFPLSQWQGSRIFRLENTNLSKKTPINNQEFWLDL